MFVVTINDVVTYLKPVSLCKLINSFKEDFAFILNDITRKGYISYNREGGKEDGYVYSFTIQECSRIVNIKVRDKATKQLLANANLVLLIKEAYLKIDYLEKDIVKLN